MNKQCLVDAGAYTALGCVSIFCGSAYYVNFVQTPAMMAVKDTKAVRDLWKEMFLRAKVYQVSTQRGTLHRRGSNANYYIHLPCKRKGGYTGADQM